MYKESENIELKRELKTTIKKEIIAFANTIGGTIYIGVEDTGVICGVINPEKEIERLSTMIGNGIKPDIRRFTLIQEVIEEGKSIIKISVAKGNKQPYFLSDKGLKPNGVYVRVGTTSQPTSEQEIRRMIISQDDYGYEEELSNIKKLTFDYTKKYFESNGLTFDENNQRTLGLINNQSEASNLGLIFSDESPFAIKIAVYSGKDVNEFKDRREFTGSVLKTLVDAFEYINMYNKTESTFRGLKRLENSDYPQIALREALVNAIVHRDYSFKGATSINIFSDRMEIISIGGLVRFLSLEDIYQGLSESRNTNLINIFYRLKLVEAYGTGIRRIISQYETYNKEPSIKVTSNAFKITLPNTNKTISMQTEKQQIKSYILQQGSITRREVEGILNVKKTKAYEVLKEMVNDDILELTEDTKKAKYILK